MNGWATMRWPGSKLPDFSSTSQQNSWPITTGRAGVHEAAKAGAVEQIAQVAGVFLGMQIAAANAADQRAAQHLPGLGPRLGDIRQREIAAFQHHCLHGCPVPFARSFESEIRGRSG